MDVDREVRKAVEANTRDATGLAQGSIVAVLQFIVAIFKRPKQ